MKVLIADDDRICRYAVGTALAEAGHSVVEAADGEQVIEKVQSDRPDVVLLDLMMPRATGWEVLRWLRGYDPDGSLPVVILSGFIADEHEFCDDPNVRAVLQKPLYIDDLFVALSRCGRLLEPA